MDTQNKPDEPLKLVLEAGGKAVINGAMVTAKANCNFEIGSGAFVLTGNALSGGSSVLHHPAEELYFSLLEVSSSEDRFYQSRYRLFNLLSQVVAQSRTHAAQKECAACAAAMMSSDTKAAIASAARLASDRLENEGARHGDSSSPLERRRERRLAPTFLRQHRLRP